MRASDVQREIDRMTTTRIVTDSNGRKHITTEPLLHPEQEPVAWRNAAIRVGEDLCSVGPFGYYDMTAEQWLDWALSVVTVHAPPAHRKPLTDEEIWEVLGGIDCTRPMLIARAIEAAHGIKGEA